MLAEPKERPILFQGDMVRAILAGAKTQTRRLVKGWALEWLQPGMFTPEYVAAPGNHACPYGVPGDRLWVRETHFAWGRWETRFSEKKGRDEWHFVDMTLECGKAYLFEPPMGWTKPTRAGATPEWWRRPAIHMPRRASRITLEVTGVRVERLQEISEADALAEGCRSDMRLSPAGPWGPSEWVGHTAVQDYAALWESINGDGSWAANPWVWAVDFRRLP